MATLTCSGYLPETPDLSPSRCRAAYEPLLNPPSYGVELVFDGKVYQLFSTYAHSPSDTVLLRGKFYLCHEPLKVFFQEFRKWVLGPHFGQVLEKHQMILGLEGLDDPLISEMEAESSDCTLWEFWEQTCDPTLRFQMHVGIGHLAEDSDVLSDDLSQSFFDGHQEESSSMSHTDPKEPAIGSPMLSPSPSITSSPSTPHELNISASSSEHSVESASFGCYILDTYDMTVIDRKMKTVMDLEKRTVFDLCQETILDLDKKSVLYLKTKSVLDLDNWILRNMTQRVGLGTTEWNSVVTTGWINVNPTLRSARNCEIDMDENLNFDDVQDDFASDTSLDSWPSRKTDGGYDADVSDQSAECDGRCRPPKMARWHH